MDIKVNFEYLEGYLPTPRSRKERFRAVRETISVPLKEVPMDALRLAYRVRNKVEIYACGDKFYRMIERGDENWFSWNQFYLKYSALESLQNICLNDENLFAPSSQSDNRDRMVARVKAYLEQFLVADGVLFALTPRPVYVIETRGMANNHGITALLVSYPEENRIFPATEPEAAVKRAYEIASERGDVCPYDFYKPDIEVFDGAGETPSTPSGFDASRHKQRLQKLTKFSDQVVSAMEPICADTCIYAKKDHENLDLYCNQCKVLKTIRYLDNALSNAEACIIDIEDAVNRSTPNSSVSFIIERYESEKEEGVDA